MKAEIGNTKLGELTPEDSAELAALTERVRGRLQRSAADILAIGADLIRAKRLVGHGHFGTWLDAEFALSKRSAEHFMAASRRFGQGSEAVSHLPAGAVLELSSPSVSDELVERVLTGDVAASVSAIRQERSDQRSDDRSFTAGGSFMDLLDRFAGTDEDYAAGVAAHVLRRYGDPTERAWFAGCLRIAAEMLEDNEGIGIPALEFPSKTVRRLIETRAVSQLASGEA